MARRALIPRLGIAALSAALASDAIDVGADDLIDVNGGSGGWTALGLVIVGSLATLAGTVAAVVSWIAALLNTWQLEDKRWFASLLALGLLGFGLLARSPTSSPALTARSSAWSAPPSLELRAPDGARA